MTEVACQPFLCCSPTVSMYCKQHSRLHCRQTAHCDTVHVVWDDASQQLNKSTAYCRHRRHNLFHL